jgi:hypothetical protein
MNSTQLSLRQQLVFISYSRRDAGLVKKLSLFLRAGGVIPWRDEEAIPLGGRWRGAIAASIEDCDRMLVFWCRHSRVSTEVEKEYRRGIDLDKPLVPVQLDRSEIPSPLSDYQAIDLREITWWSHEIARWERYPWLVGLLLLLIGMVYVHL